MRIISRRVAVGATIVVIVLVGLSFAPVIFAGTKHPRAKKHVEKQPTYILSNENYTLRCYDKTPNACRELVDVLNELQEYRRAVREHPDSRHFPSSTPRKASPEV